MSLLLVALFATACASEGAAPTDEEAVQAGQEADSKDYTGGTPWLDCDIDSNVTADTPTDPKDNYALYANKDALLSLELTDDSPAAGRMVTMANQASEDIKQMFLKDRPESHDARLAYDLFWLMKDWDSRNALGVAPLKERIDAVEAISTIDDLTTYLSTTAPEDQLGLLWSNGEKKDPKDSSHYILSLSNMKLMLISSEEYIERTSFGEMYQSESSKLVTKVLVKAGYSEEEATEKVENCLAFETLLAPSITTSKDKQKSAYLKRVEKHYSRDEINEMAQKLPILAVFEQAEGYPEMDNYLVMEPDFFAKLNEVYTEENLTLMKDYLIVHGTYDLSQVLDRECYEWYMQSMAAVEGSTEIPDDDTAFADSMGMLNWAVARMYTETYLNQEDKDRISELVDEIIETYHGILSEADFLSDETRAKAIEKLDAIEKRVLYPDDWSAYNYDGLDYASKEEGGTYWDAWIAIKKYLHQKDVEAILNPVEKDEWNTAPQVTNCSYDPPTNSIYIMGAFARSVYSSDMSDEQLYGTVGAAIAHEISHAFDPTGSKFDKDGNMTNWWTDEDRKVFDEKADKLAAYFNNIHPWEGQDLDGEAMTGEASADMAGFKCLLRLASTKPDFDYDTFFRSFAGMWLMKMTPMIAEMSVDDVHPLSYLRTNTTLQQYDEFLDFYGVKEGDAMYLAPEDRVNIW